MREEKFHHDFYQVEKHTTESVDFRYPPVITFCVHDLYNYLRVFYLREGEKWMSAISTTKKYIELQWIMEYSMRASSWRHYT